MNAPGAADRQVRVEAFGRRHRTGVVTLLFSDIVGSTQLKQSLGDARGAGVIQWHHALVRETLGAFPEAEEIDNAGDSFFLVFAKPSDAVKFAVQVQGRLGLAAKERTPAVLDRIGIHVGEVLIQEATGANQPKHLYGVQVDTCARVMSLAAGGQILMTRFAFDSARQALRGQDLEGAGQWRWLNHGPYLFKGIEEPIEVCEVRLAAEGAVTPPTSTEKAQRYAAPGQEPVLGWRPAIGQRVGGTPWVLEAKLGEGGFGEVWLGRHLKLKEPRVFKFCFRADRVRALKREVTLFRLLKERMGEHPHIVRLLDVYFDEPPFYIAEEYVGGKDLAGWCEEQGGVGRVPLETKLEIVAQAAEALQAAHDAGVIHRDVKPGNILVSGQWFVASEPPATSHQPLMVKLTDFGIGQVVSQECLAGVTKAGFTMTMLAPGSSSQTGTQLYMAPELLEGKPATTRSDIYSLGVVLYQLLVGDFKRSAATDWAKRIGDPLLREDLERCLAGEPEDRFSGAVQLAESLRAYERRQEEAAERARAVRRRKFAGASFLAAGLLLVVSLALGIGLNEARKERDRARLEAYVSDMKLADTAWQEHNLGEAMTALRRHIPKPGEADLRGIEWRYLWQNCQGQQTRTFRHHAEVTCAELSPDARWLATESGGAFWVWDTARKGEPRALSSGAPAEQAAGEHLAFDSQGRFLATATTNNVVLWNIADWHKLRILPATNASLSFSGDGTTLATFGVEGIQVWKARTWERLVRPGEITNGFNAFPRIALNRDGSLLAASCSGVGGPGTVSYVEGQVALWEVRRRQLLFREREVKDAQSLAFSGDGHWLAASTLRPPATVWLWSVPDGKLVSRWRVSQGLGRALAFAPGGRRLTTAGSDQVISLWETGKTNRPLGLLQGHLSEISSLRFAADGRLVSASNDKTVRLWNIRQEHSSLRAFSLPPGRLIDPQTADVRRIACVNLADLTFEQWDVETGQRLRRTRIQGADAILHHGTLVNGKPLQSGIFRDYFAGDVDVAPGVNRVKHLCPLKPVAGAGPGWGLCATTGDGHFYAWNAESGNLVYSNKVASNLIAAFPSGDDKTLILLQDFQGPFFSYELKTNRKDLIEAHALVSPTGMPVSPDGRFFACITAAGQVSIWDFATRRNKQIVNLPALTYVQLAFSPDSRLLAVAKSPQGAQVWDVGTGRRVGNPMAGYSPGIFKVSFSADGKSLVTYEVDYTATIWNIATGREMISGLPLNRFLTQHPAWTLLPTGGNSVIESAGEGAIRVVRLPKLAEIDALENAQTKKR